MHIHLPVSLHCLHKGRSFVHIWADKRRSVALDDSYSHDPLLQEILLSMPFHVSWSASNSASISLPSFIFSVIFIIIIINSFTICLYNLVAHIQGINFRNGKKLVLEIWQQPGHLYVCWLPGSFLFSWLFLCMYYVLLLLTSCPLTTVFSCSFRTFPCTWLWFTQPLCSNPFPCIFQCIFMAEISDCFFPWSLNLEILNSLKVIFFSHL